jgi:hypothetical protein
MSSAAIVFWAGMGGLSLISVILRYLEAERMAFRLHSAQLADTRADRDIAPHRAEPVRHDDAPAAQWSPFALTAAGWQPVHKIRKERAEALVWQMDQCDGADEAHCTYAVTVDRLDPRCGRCVACTNEAIHWIQDHEQVSLTH